MEIHSERALRCSAIVTRPSFDDNPVTIAPNCTEEGCIVDSDSIFLTNIIRRHYLQYFGYRDVAGIVDDYADENAIMVSRDNVATSEKFHGKNEIWKAFVDIFSQHPVEGSTFHLKEIRVKQHHGTAIWEARTPEFHFPLGTDEFVFDQDSKIIKQTFVYEKHPVNA